jgi:hypothetical protein
MCCVLMALGVRYLDVHHVTAGHDHLVRLLFELEPSVGPVTGAE